MMSNARTSLGSLSERRPTTDMYRVNSEINLLENELLILDRDHQDAGQDLQKLWASCDFKRSRYATSTSTRSYFDLEERNHLLSPQRARPKNKIQELRAYRDIKHNQEHEQGLQYPATSYSLSQETPGISQTFLSQSSHSSREFSSSQETQSSASSAASEDDCAECGAHAESEIAESQERGLQCENQGSGSPSQPDTGVLFEDSDEQALGILDSDQLAPQDFFRDRSNNQSNVSDRKILLILAKESGWNMSNEDRKRGELILEHMFAQAIHNEGDDGHCWIYEGPEANIGGEKVQKYFNFKDQNCSRSKKTQSLNTQVGILWMVIKKSMTEEQKHGWIHESWHLSHLCGNWRCIRPSHHTMEPGRINWDRKQCHSGSRPYYACTHAPRCLLHYKDGKPKPIKLLGTQFKPAKKFYQSRLVGCPHGIAVSASRRPASALRSFPPKMKGNKRKAPDKGDSRGLKQAKLAFKVQDATPPQDELPFDPDAMTWFTLSSASKTSTTQSIVQPDCQRSRQDSHHHSSSDPSIISKPAMTTTTLRKKAFPTGKPSERTGMEIVNDADKMDPFDWLSDYYS